MARKPRLDATVGSWNWLLFPGIYVFVADHDGLVGLQAWSARQRNCNQLLHWAPSHNRLLDRAVEETQRPAAYLRIPEHRTNTLRVTSRFHSLPWPGKAENGPEYFHNHPVTSNLAPNSQQADHGQSGGSIGRESNSMRNSFALKILTLKSSAIKILQTLFANPAPRKPLRGIGGGGIPQE